MTNLYRTFLSAIAVCLLTAGQTSAVVFSTSTNDGIGADTYIQRGNANANFNNSSHITIKDSGTGSTTRKGYLRLDLSGADGPFIGAGLDLRVSINNSGGNPLDPAPDAFVVNVYGLNNGDAGENWGETTTTWNNAPGNVTANNTLATNTTLLGSFNVPAVPAGNTINFNSASLATFLNQDTDGRASLILQRDRVSNEVNLAFNSNRNNSPNAPSLTGNIDGILKTVTTGMGQGADAYVRGGTNGGNNYGNSQNLVVKHSSNSSFTRHAYLKFDLSDIGEALHAGLTLDVLSNNGGGNDPTPKVFTVEVFGLNDGESGENWAEGTIDYNNAPGHLGSNNGMDPSTTTFLGSFVVEDNPGGRVIFANEDLIDFLNADTNDLVTLMLRRNGGNGGYNLVFASDEHGSLQAPRLDIVERIVPEPATATLALLGLGALARRRRRSLA
jgi:hypothetical protein